MIVIERTEDEEEEDARRLVSLTSTKLETQARALTLRDRLAAIKRGEPRLRSIDDVDETGPWLNSRS